LADFVLRLHRIAERLGEFLVFELAVIDFQVFMTRSDWASESHESALRKSKAVTVHDGRHDVANS
jgi:hypothetical protein